MAGIDQPHNRTTADMGGFADAVDPSFRSIADNIMLLDIE